MCMDVLQKNWCECENCRIEIVLSRAFSHFPSWKHESWTEVCLWFNTINWWSNSIIVTHFCCRTNASQLSPLYKSYQHEKYNQAWATVITAYSADTTKKLFVISTCLWHATFLCSIQFKHGFLFKTWGLCIFIHQHDI